MNHKYAVFGSPVLHSKSPQLFKPLMQEAASYTRIRPQSAEDILRIVKTLKISGASITAPFKESLLPLLDDLTYTARAIGAVNCIRHEDGAVYGHNTDFMGVIGALEEARAKMKGAKILILGAGGAARAAVYGLVKAGSEVYIANRTKAKAQVLADTFGANTVDWEEPKELPFFDVVVSTILPEALPPFIGHLDYGLFLDAVYKPSRMNDVTRSRQIRCVGGDRWLIYQGLAASDFYIKKESCIDKIRKELAETIGRENLKTYLTGNHNPPSPQSQSVTDKTFTKETVASLKSLPLIKRIEHELSQELYPPDMKVLVLNEKTATHAFDKEYDLLVSGFDLDETAVTKILNEEKYLAFGN